MAVANINLSSLFRDPDLRRAFVKAERDSGFAFAIPAPIKHDLLGGARVEVPEFEMA